MCDITELKNTEQELHRLNRTLKALSGSGYTMSHSLCELEYFYGVCKIFADYCGHRMVRIGFIGEVAEKVITPAGFGYDFLGGAKMTRADLNGRCPKKCGRYRFIHF